MRGENWNCCGAGPHDSGNVKVYPLGGGGNLILCAYCWERENAYRRRRQREYARADRCKCGRVNCTFPNCEQCWPILNWDTAEVYPT